MDRFSHCSIVLICLITVLKVGRVAIITRGRYAGKKVNFSSHDRRNEYAGTGLRGIRLERDLFGVGFKSTELMEWL